jgi:uncharacterized protein YkwD
MTAAVALPPWAAWTASPVALARPLGPLEQAALDRCGEGDEGLRDAAARIAGARARGLAMPELDGIAFAQRASGEPHPWARAWAATAQGLAIGAVAPRLDAWLAAADGAVSRVRLRRCGVAAVEGAGGARTLVVVAVDALADLHPLPTRARTGQWLSVEAPLRVPARGGSVVVLGPIGAPRAVPTSYDGATLRARFALDAPGEFSVQVIAALPSGPRPVLEASVFADVEPPAAPADVPAPGEEAASGELPDAGSREGADALQQMLSAARLSAGLAPLDRDRRLDAVALAHATAMAARRDLAHDAGDGDPLERLRAAGYAGPAVGENVAHAASLSRAHRATWASPSHRANLLRRELTRVGVGVARDADGSVWLAEELTGAWP